QGRRGGRRCRGGRCGRGGRRGRRRRGGRRGDRGGRGRRGGLRGRRGGFGCRGGFRGRRGGRGRRDKVWLILVLVSFHSALTFLSNLNSAAGAGGAAGAFGGAVGFGGAAGASGGAAGAGGARGAAGGAAAAGAAGGAGVAGGAVAAGGAAGTGEPGAEGPGALQPASPLPGPYSGPTGGLTERREPESHPLLPASRSPSPVHAVRAGRVSRPHLPPVPGTHSMTLRPSTAPQHVPLPSPPTSSLPDGPDPESDSLRAASPAVPRFLATAVTDPLLESSAASAIVAELDDFAAACRLDYAASLVATSASVYVCPPSVRDPDALDIPTPRSYAEAIEGSYSSQWQAAMDAEMASWKSTGTYVDEVPPPGANILSGMWIFRVKRPPGSTPAFKARYVARGFSQRQGVDFFQTFSPTPKMTTLWVLLHIAAQRDYELNSHDFSTAFLQGSLHEEIWLRRPPGFTGSFLADLGEVTSYLGLRITRDRAQRTITSTQSHMVQQVLQRFDFTYSSSQSTPLPTGHSLSAPPSDESVEPSGPYPELVGYLMYLMTCTRPDLAYPLSLLARYVAPGRHRKVHWDAAKRVLRYLCSTLGMGLVLGGRARVVLTGHADASWVDDLATQRSTRSSSVLSSSCEAEIYAGAMAAQELRWLTYLLTNLGEAPRSPPVLFSYLAFFLALRGLSSHFHTFWTRLRYGLPRLSGDCYLCVPPDPGIEAAALGAGETAALGASASAAPGAGESAPSGIASAQVFHTFTLDSGASRSFFRDRTTLTPLSRPVAVSLADPSGGPVLASFSTVLPCPAAPSGSLSGLYLPLFSTNMVSGADLQDQGVDQFTPASQRVTHCKCARTGRHLATFTRRPGSSLYTLSTESSSVSASGQVAASSQVLAAASGSGPESAPCSCRLLSHQTLLWHHRLGHPSLPRLRGMASRVLVSGLPRSLPPLPPGPAPTCVPCVEGRQRAAPHSSEFPPTQTPLQTLHMDVWGPARVRGQDHERYFLLVVDDYSRYTTVFPLRSKGEVTEVLIDWIRAARLRLRESFGSDFPVLRLHSDRGGEFSSALLGAFCRAQGIRQTFTLPASPQQNGIAERRIGMSWGAETEGAEPGGAETGGAEPGGAATGGPEPEGAEPGGAGSTRVASRGASSRREVLSPQELREWFARRWSRAAGAGGTTATTCPGGAGAAGPGGPTEAAGVGPTRGSAGASGGTGAAGSAGPEAAGATGVRAAGSVGAGGSADAGTSEGAGAGGATGARAPAGSPGTVPAGSGGALRPRPYFVPLLEQVLGLPPSPGPAPSFECPQPVQSQSLLQRVSPLPAPSPYTGPTGGLAERRAPASRPASHARPACTSRRTSRPRPPPVPGTHQMALRPSTAPLRVPLPSPPASFLPTFPDPESDSLRAASPTVTRFLATVVTDPSLASTAAFSLVAELVDFAASCRLDYAASLVAESKSVYPPSVGGECALSTDVLEDRQEEFQVFAAALPHLVSTLLAPEGDPDAPDIPNPRSYAEAIEGPYSSQWQAAMDAEMASWKSTGTYVDEVPPPGANIVSGMWIFRVKRPPGSPPVFKARYVARGFSQLVVDSLHRGAAVRRSSLLRVPSDGGSPADSSHGRGEVTEVLIDWIRAARRQLSESFGSDLPVLRLHSDRGGEFSSDLLRAFCRAEGIRQTFTLLASPQKNGIAERRIGMVMDVARTSMIHAAAPHFLWPFAVQYAAHQINSSPGSPCRRPHLLCGGQGRLVMRLRSVSGDLELSSATCLRTSCPPVLFPASSLASPLTRLGPAPSGVSQVDVVEPVEVAVDSGAEFGGAESGGAEPGVTESVGAEAEGAKLARVESGGAAPGGPLGASSWREPLSPQQLRGWFTRRWSRAAGAGGAMGAGGPAAARVAGGSGATGPGGACTGGSRAAGPGGAAGAGAAGGAGAGGTTGPDATGGAGPGAAGGAGASGGPAGAGAPGGAGAGGAGAGGAARAGAPWGGGVGATGAAGGAGGAGGTTGVGADAGGAGVVLAGSGGAARPRPYFVPLLEQSASPLPAPSPYTGPTGGLTERCEPESHHSSPVRAARIGRRGLRQRPPPVPGTHQMALRPSTAPQCVPLPSPPESSLPALADPEFDSLRAASPTVTRLLATLVTDPSFESTPASALVAELVDFAAHCRLDYAASLVAESASVCPLSVSDPDASDIPTPRFYTEAIEGPYSSQWQSAMDAEMASEKSTGTYVDEVPPPGANIVDGMWIFRVKRLPSSLPVFKARYMARGFSQRQGVDYFQTFSLVFAVADTEGLALVKSELQKRHTCIVVAPSSDESVEPSGLYPKLVGCLIHRPEHWKAAKRVLRYLCSTSGMELVLEGQGPVILTRHADASWVDDLATQRSSQGYTFSLGSGSVEPSCSPPVLYVDNKAMISLCEEYRLEHRTKHISPRYFLARELQQCGQLRLAYVASRANTADIFTKAL
ncbi:unnamed protein product, partial [Closterium sp. NIES-54]